MRIWPAPRRRNTLDGCLHCLHAGSAHPPQAMSWPVYYSQTGMFVGFMHDTDPAAFGKMLAALGRREAFADAVSASYGRPLAALWQEFLASLGA
jgi:hypothetical protein